MLQREREREKVFVCVCVCVRTRARACVRDGLAVLFRNVLYTSLHCGRELMGLYCPTLIAPLCRSRSTVQTQITLLIPEEMIY